MGHDVFVVNDTVLLREESVRERSILIIANTRLAEVDHSSVNASIDQFHRGKLSESTTQTMACSLYLEGWEKGLKSLHFGQDICKDR